MNWPIEEYNAWAEKHGKEAITIKRNKYNAIRTDGYDSKHECEVATELHMRAKAERITVLEQFPFDLTGIKYIADFVILHLGGVYEATDAKV